MISLALFSYRHLPKAELNTRNSTKRRRKASFGWVSGVQLDSQEKSDPPSAENRVKDARGFIHQSALLGQKGRFLSDL